MKEEDEENEDEEEERGGSAALSGRERREQWRRACRACVRMSVLSARGRPRSCEGKGKKGREGGREGGRDGEVIF
jgi:L-fucose isomerase-like protein